MKPSILQLRGIHVSDLFNCCNNPLDKQDPCAHVTIGTKRVETARKVDAGTDVVFDEEFDVILKEDLSNIELKVEVFHKNALGFKTHLGVGSKNLLDLIPTYDEHISFVIALYNNTKKIHKGQVTITGYLSNQNSPSHAATQQSDVSVTETNSAQLGTKRVFEVPKDSTLYSKYDACKIDELVQIMNNYDGAERIVDAILMSPILVQTQCMQQTQHMQQASDSSAAVENKPDNDSIQGSNEVQQDLSSSAAQNSSQNVVKSIKTVDFSSFVDPLMIYNDTKPRDISKYTSNRSKSVVGTVDYGDPPPLDTDTDDDPVAGGKSNIAPPVSVSVEKKLPKILKKVLEKNRQVLNDSAVDSTNSRKSEFLDAAYLQILSSKKPPTETPTKSKQLEKYRRLSTNVVHHNADHDEGLDTYHLGQTII